MVSIKDNAVKRRTGAIISFVFIFTLVGVILLGGSVASAATIKVTAPSGTVEPGGNVQFEVSWDTTSECIVKYTANGGTLAGKSSNEAKGKGSGAKNVIAGSSGSVTLTAKIESIYAGNASGAATDSATVSIKSKTVTSTIAQVAPNSAANYPSNSTVKVGQIINFGFRYYFKNAGSKPERVCWDRYIDGVFDKTGSVDVDYSSATETKTNISYTPSKACTVKYIFYDESRDFYTNSPVVTVEASEAPASGNGSVEEAPISESYDSRPTDTGVVTEETPISGVVWDRDSGKIKVTGNNVNRAEYRVYFSKEKEAPAIDSDSVQNNSSYIDTAMKWERSNITGTVGKTGVVTLRTRDIPDGVTYIAIRVSKKYGNGVFAKVCSAATSTGNIFVNTGVDSSSTTTLDTKKRATITSLEASIDSNNAIILKGTGKNINKVHFRIYGSNNKNAKNTYFINGGEGLGPSEEYTLTSGQGWETLSEGVFTIENGTTINQMLLEKYSGTYNKLMIKVAVSSIVSLNEKSKCSYKFVYIDVNGLQSTDAGGTTSVDKDQDVKEPTVEPNIDNTTTWDSTTWKIDKNFAPAYRYVTSLIGLNVMSAPSRNTKIATKLGEVKGVVYVERKGFGITDNEWWAEIKFESNTGWTLGYIRARYLREAKDTEIKQYTGESDPNAFPQAQIDADNGGGIINLGYGSGITYKGFYSYNSFTKKTTTQFLRVLDYNNIESEESSYLYYVYENGTPTLVKWKENDLFQVSYKNQANGAQLKFILKVYVNKDNKTYLYTYESDAMTVKSNGTIEPNTVVYFKTPQKEFYSSNDEITNEDSQQNQQIPNYLSSGSMYLAQGTKGSGGLYTQLKLKYNDSNKSDILSSSLYAVPQDGSSEVNIWNWNNSAAPNKQDINWWGVKSGTYSLRYYITTAKAKYFYKTPWIIIFNDSDNTVFVEHNPSYTVSFYGDIQKEDTTVPGVGTGE